MHDPTRHRRRTRGVVLKLTIHRAQSNMLTANEVTAAILAIIALWQRLNNAARSLRLTNRRTS